MATQELIRELRKLSRAEVSEGMQAAGFGPLIGDGTKLDPPEGKARGGLTPGLLRGAFVHVSDDFDAALPDSFWTGDGTDSDS